MGIDSSIFNNVQAPQVNIPSPLDMAQKSMALSQLGMQQMQMARQMRTQSAVQEAYAGNTDPESGQLNRQGFLSSLAKQAPAAAIDYQNQFAKNDKDVADSQAAKLDASQKAYNLTGPAFEYMSKMPEDQRAAAYPQVIQQLKDQGVDTSKMDHPYDPQLFNQYLGTWHQNKDYLANQLVQAQTGKTNTEADQIGISKGAEELGKFNEDVNNPTNRKVTGGLTDIINRSDRIVALANAGAPPNETPQQRTDRLNKIMPQISKEFNISLATIMQGGVPTEGLNKELGTDTVDSALAQLKQRISGTPTGANQAQMIQQYVDTAQHLRNFAAGRLQDITDKSSAAYPYAQKYFPDRMAKIASPLAAPQSGSIVTPGGSGGMVESSANAAGPSSKRTSAATPPGMIRMINPTDKKVYIIPLALKGEAIASGGSVAK